MRLQKLYLSITFLFFIFSSFTIFGEGLNAKKNKLLPIPIKFDTYVKESFLYNIYNDNEYVSNYKKSRSDVAWEVWSDRDGNKSYYNQDTGEEPKATLSLMQKFYVKEVINNWIHIVDIDFSKRKAKEIDYGWIQAKKLVLSRFTQLNDKGAPKKGMILTSLSSSSLDLDNAEILRLISENKYYTNPDLSTKYLSNNVANKFNFLFILKKVGNAYLLSRSDEIMSSKNEIKYDVRGWVPKSKVTEWDHRVCLEPWYGREASAKYRNKTLYVFEREDYLENYISSGFALKTDKWALKKTKLKQKRQLATQMRMPILDWDGNNNQRKKVAAIAQMQSNLRSLSEADCDKACQVAKIQWQIDSLRKLEDNVDVLIVFDGTSSMKSFAKPMQESIKRIIRQRKVEGKQKFRWGLAVYRDYLDEDEGRDFEIYPFSSNEQVIYNALNNIEFKSLNRQKHNEAHYNGMIRSIKEINFTKGRSNMLILVGDAGNHLVDKNGYNRQMVTDLINQYKINLISFQVNYFNNAAYPKFNSDVRGYIKNAAKNRISLANYKKINPKPIFKKLKNDQNSESVSFTDLPENLWPMFGAFKWAERGNRLNPRIFEDNFNNLFIKYMDRLDVQRGKLKEIKNGIRNGSPIKKVNIESFEDIDNFLREKGFTENQIELLRTQGQLSVNGYIHMNIGELPSAYRPVMFISRSFKERVIDDRLQQIASFNGNISKTRDHLYNTFIALIRGMVGEGEKEKTIKQYTLNQVWDILLGIKFDSNSPLRDVKIKDLKSSRIDDEKIENFIAEFKNDVDKFLTKPYDDRYTLFEAAEQEYLWIPLADVPGCGDGE